MNVIGVVALLISAISQVCLSTPISPSLRSNAKSPIPYLRDPSERLLIFEDWRQKLLAIVEPTSNSPESALRKRQDPYADDGSNDSGYPGSGYNPSNDPNGDPGAGESPGSLSGGESGSLGSGSGGESGSLGSGSGGESGSSGSGGGESLGSGSGGESGASGSSGGSTGLSAGAKGGIAVGVIIAASLSSSFW